MMHCLWLARSLPFPQTSGDRIYSLKLAAALANANLTVTFAGFLGDAPADPIPHIVWHVVPGGPRGQLAGLLSRMPLVGGRHDTPAYRTAIAHLAAVRHWDAVVVDHYGMGWVLEERARFGDPAPRFAFVTHDHEESVTRLQWLDRGASPLRRAYLLQNYLKTRWFERWTARHCDLVTTITEADAAHFCATSPGPAVLPLVPGHDGPRTATYLMPADRAVVLLGSYRWSAKVANLRIFLDRADPILSAAGIEIRVVGDMPDELRRQFAASYPGTHFTGFVEDPVSHLARARLAVLAEPIGGGFKMKLLDYIFNRLPVAALEACASGLPAPVREAMLLSPDLDSLLARVIATIDDVSTLDHLQREAFAAASGAFDWADRGIAFRNALLGASAPQPELARADAR